MSTASMPPTGAPRAIAATMLVSLTLLAGGCATLRPSSNSPSTAIPASSDTRLGAMASAAVGPAGGSAFRPLPFSQYSMDARLSLALHATRSLDVQYYLLQNDATGHALLRALRDAAVRGVRVRLLVDDLYTAQSDRLLEAFDTYPNVEVRVFNPFPAGRSFAATRWLFSALDFARVNHRMHNKLFIADGAFAVVGGRNIADEYFFHSREGNFIDFDLLTAGDAVSHLAELFDRYWNSPRVHTLAALESTMADHDVARARFDADTRSGETAIGLVDSGARDGLGYSAVSADLSRGALDMIHGTMEAFADDPEKVSGRSEAGDDASTVTSRVLAAMSTAHHEVFLVSPYFVPGPRGMDALAALRARGITVKLVTNTLAANDEPYASVAYARYRKRMLAMGIEIYEISSSRIRLHRDVGRVIGTTIGRSHAKVIVIDGQTTFVGSMNLDLRSSRENTEIGTLVASPELARTVTELFHGVVAVGAYRLRLDGDHIQWLALDGDTTIVYDDEPEVEFATRLKSIFVAPFISEGLL